MFSWEDLREEAREGMKKKNGAMICGFRTSKNRMNGKNRIIITDLKLGGFFAARSLAGRDI